MSKWSYEVDCWGGGNREEQCYTSRPQNIRIENGNLVLTAKVERYTGSNAGCTSQNGGCVETRDFTSARVRTIYDPAGSWRYGKWEIRAKLPRGNHLWPALWMLPTDRVYGWWAASGEIDIMEARGEDTSAYEGTLHFGGAWPNNLFQGSGRFGFPQDLAADFHIFGLEWEADEMRWLLDGNVFFRMNLNRNFWSGRGGNPYNANRQPFDQRFHFIINLAVGGGFFPNPYISPAEAQGWQNPNFMIDYVRVYQR